MAATSRGVKDEQTITHEGEVVRDLLHGVIAKEMPNIMTRNGYTTEVMRTDWGLPTESIEHLIHVVQRAHALSAWHRHELQTDHIFVTEGTFKLVLFDDREDSPTRGGLNVMHLSRYRPTLVLIPPGVWHGIQNLDATPSSFINLFDRPYCHENPDEYRLPFDAEEIPYRF